MYDERDERTNERRISIESRNVERMSSAHLGYTTIKIDEVR